MMVIRVSMQAKLQDRTEAGMRAGEIRGLMGLICTLCVSPRRGWALHSRVGAVYGGVCGLV